MQTISSPSDVITIRRAGYTGRFERGFLVESIGRARVDQFVRDLDGRAEQGTLIKTDKKTSIYICDLASQALVIKRYNYRGALHALRQTVWGTRARRAWKNGLILQYAHIPTPQVLACIEIKRLGVVLWSYIVTECFVGDNLHFYLVKRQPDQAGRKKIIGALQHLIDQMGAHRITHGDMKPSNFMLNDQGQAALIDLDGMKLFRFSPFYQRRRDKDLRAFKRRILDEIVLQGPRIR